MKTAITDAQLAILGTNSFPEEKTWRPSRVFQLGLPTQATGSQIQQIKTAGYVPRQVSQSPNSNLIPGAVNQSIPRQLSKVRVSHVQISPTQTRITVQFTRDASDPNYSGTKVWLKGYNGRNNIVSVAQGTDSPISFIVDRTGDGVSVIAQANGNTGAALLSGAQVSSLKL